MSKAKQAIPATATATLAGQMAATATVAAATLPTRKYYGANVAAATLPAAWAARAGAKLVVTNSLALAHAVQRRQQNGQAAQAQFYAAMAHSCTVQEWANTLQTAGVWQAVGLYTKPGNGEHPTKFLDAAMRNGWIRKVSK